MIAVINTDSRTLLSRYRGDEFLYSSHPDYNTGKIFWYFAEQNSDSVSHTHVKHIDSHPLCAGKDASIHDPAIPVPAARVSHKSASSKVMVHGQCKIP